MAGIGVEFPIGPGWKHSLDNDTWQVSNIFQTQVDGSPFVEGETYTVFHRHELLNFNLQSAILFGAPNNDDTLDVVAKRGGSKAGWTNKQLQLMGGLKAILPETEDETLPVLVLDEDDTVKVRFDKVKTKLPSLTLGAQKIEKEVVTLVDIIFLGPTSVTEGTSIQKDAYRLFSDESKVKITAIGQRSISSLDATWGSDGVLFATANQTPGDTRTVTITIVDSGITKTEVITIVDATNIVPNGEYRISNASLIEGDATGVLVHLEMQFTDNHWEAVTVPHLFEWVDAFPGLTVAMEALQARLKCAMGSINQNTSRVLRAYKQSSQAYNVTLQSETQSGTGTVYNQDGTKEGTIEYQFTGLPSAGNYAAVIRLRSNNSAPTARISINNGTPFDVPLTATDGVIQSFNLILPLPAGDPKVKVQPIGYFAQDSLQINGTGSAKEVLATVTIPIQNVDPTSECTGHPTLTQEESDAMTKIPVYEYHEAGQYARVFSSRAEAIAIIPTQGEPNSACGFDFNPCTSTTAEVGAILYNDNRLPSTQYPEGEHFRRPVEAGWWGWNKISASDFYVIRTDACGNIISKEHITL